MNWPAFWRGFLSVFNGRAANDAWCSFAHDAGQIKRDEQGRINWQCNKCGRWSAYPVPLEDEREVINRRLPVARKEKA